MPDGSSAVISTTDYARIYEEQQPRLVAYARSLTRNSWAADDLVAEAHFRVWRRLAEGHEIDNVSAYLTTTVRHLAYAAGGAVRETPRDPHADEQAEAGRHGEDPAEQVSSVDLLVRVLAQLPERWVKALWLAEAEGQPLAQIGPQLGTKEGATAVLLHRAREGMRQAFLRTQTGAPDDPACQVHWSRMPAYVRGAATQRQSDRLLGHVDDCADCRARLAALMRANDRLPALVGPALLVFAVGGTAGRFLLTLTAAGASAGGHGGGSGLLHGVRQGAGGTKAPMAVAAGAMAAGAVALVLLLGPGHASPVTAQRTPVADAPLTQAPVTVAPAVPRNGDAGDGTSTGTAAQARTGVTTTPSEGARNGNGNGNTTPPETTGPTSPATPSPTPPVGTEPTPPASTGPAPTPPTPPTAPTEPTDPPPPTDPKDPVPPTEPTSPTPPTEPTEPTEPTPPTDPTDPVPVEPPPAGDPCPPPHGDGDRGKGGGGKGDGGGDRGSGQRVPRAASAS